MKIIFFIVLCISLNADMKVFPAMDMLDTFKGMSKEKGGQYSDFLIGVVYLNGDGEKVGRDIPKALKYLKKASSKLAYANYILGYVYTVGLNDKVDYNLAIKYFKKASIIDSIDSSEISPVALAAIGNVYFNYLNDPKKALSFLLKASVKKTMPNVDFMISIIYYLSKPPLQNKDLAEVYLKRAYKNAGEPLRNKIDKYIIKEK